MSDNINEQINLTAQGNYTTNRSSGVLNFNTNPSIYVIDTLANITHRADVTFYYNRYIIKEVNGEQTVTTSEDLSTYGVNVDFSPSIERVTNPNFNESVTFNGLIDIPFNAFAGEIKKIIVGKYHSYRKNDILTEAYGWADADVDIDKTETTNLKVTLNLTFTINVSGSIQYKFNKDLTSILHTNDFPTPCPSSISFSALNLNGLNSSELEYKIPILTSIPTSLGSVFNDNNVYGILKNTENSTSRVGSYYLAPNNFNYGLLKTVIYGGIGADSIFHNGSGAQDQDITFSEEDEILYPVGYYVKGQQNNIFCCLPEGLTGHGLFVGNNSVAGSWNELANITLLSPDEEEYNGSNDANGVYYSNKMFDEDAIWVPQDGSSRVCGDRLIFSGDNLPEEIRCGNITASAIYYIDGNRNNDDSSNKLTFNFSAYTVSSIDYQGNTGGVLVVSLSAPSLTKTTFYVNQGEAQIIPQKTYDNHIILFSKANGLSTIGISPNNISSLPNENTILYTTISLNDNFYKANNIFGYLKYSITTTA